jgi:hypothetical protein
MSEREMTLEEWVHRLPEIHAARREYESLRSRLVAAEARLLEAQDCLFTYRDAWLLSLTKRIDAHLARPCTCHPDDNPPVPCPRKYALTECRATAARET